MKYAILLMTLTPAILIAQELQFEIQPEAFPVEIDSWQPFCPWSGGIDNTTPEFCDIDADGDLDYFSGSSQNLFWFFKNTGTATFPDFNYVSAFFDSIYPICPGSASESDIDFCDIDADGDQDALLCNGCIGVSINQGTSWLWNFSSPPDTLFDVYGAYLWATNMAAADIDADGDFDLFGGTYYSGELRFFNNIGTPEQYEYMLITESWQGVQALEGKADPCFADLDADGDLDLLVGTGEGTVYYYRNDGDSANPQMTYVTDNYFNIDVGEDASPELADIDGDGDLDLFVGREPPGFVETMGDVFFYQNTGTPHSPNFQLITSNYLAVDIGKFCKPRLIDIDADGDPDLLSSISLQLVLFRDQGIGQSPLFVYETDNFAGITTPGALVPWFCDVDADSDYDLFVGPGAIPGPPGLYLFLNQGTPQTPNYVLYSSDLVPDVFTQSSVVLSPSTTDIDADGDHDLFVSDDNGLFYYFQNIGTPAQFQFNFVTSNWQNIADPWLGGHRLFCFYDIDTDNDPDLFISSWENPGLMFYRNVGSPQVPNLQLESEHLLPDYMIWQAAPFLTDMDQDGDGDMFVGDTWGGIRYFKNVTGEPPGVMPKVTAPYRGPVLTLGPNPANPSTWISFTLTAPQEATLAVYNILGARVITLTSGPQKPGEHTYYWNASQNASGVYIIRLEMSKYWSAEKITVVK